MWIDRYGHDTARLCVISMTGDVRSEDGSAGTLNQTPDLAAAACDGSGVGTSPRGELYQTTYSIAP